MSLSLRIPPAMEYALINTSAQLGLTKTALILRGIEHMVETYAEEKAKSGFELYEEAMSAAHQDVVDHRVSHGGRPHKQAIAKQIIAKHQARRSRGAKSASAK